MQDLALLWLAMSTVIVIFTGYRIMQHRVYGTSVRTALYTVIAVCFLSVPIWANFFLGDSKEETAQGQLNTAMTVISASDTMFTLSGNEDDYIILPIKQYAIDTLTLEGNSTRLNYTSTLYDTPLMIIITRQFE